MKSRFTNRISNLLSHAGNNMSSALSSFYVKYVICPIKGIAIGRGNKFNGVPYLFVDNGGIIQIGSHNRFNSSPSSNNMGINHRCMVCATPAVTQSCKIKIGNHCGFSGTSIWCFSGITIGNDVRCGANTLIMDGDAHFDDWRTSPPEPIVIEDNVFLGAGVIVRKGVRIGKNSVIGMNSMVTHDIPANVIAVGTPCKVIKQLNK